MIIKGVLQHGWWLENPDLGAPFGQEFYDFPVMVGDSLHLALIKLLGVFSSEPVLVLNLFFLLSFPLIALVSFLVLRQLGISSAAALVCSVLYALAPYHFVRGETHLFLSAYYSVPVGAYLVLSLLSGRPLFTRCARTGGPRLLAWASERSLVTLALGLLVACAGTTYYTVFTLMLLIAAMVIVVVTRRDVRALAQGSILFGVIVGFLLLGSLPNLMYEFENGPNHVAQRGPEESDTYSLKLAQMVLPVPDHQIDALSNLAKRYYENPNQATGEGPDQALGFVTALGFAWLLLVALAGCLSPRWRSGNLLLHRQLATATVIAFLIGTTGGISTLFAYLVSPQIRSWNRISILIAFFAIAAVALLLDALQRRVQVHRGRYILVGALLSSVLLIGLYDQRPSTFVPDYSAAKSEYESDAVLVRAIDSELPPQAEVFQLPYMPFPEGPPPIDEPNWGWGHVYELLKPYLHESDLRWSFGAVKGRPAADWQADLADKSIDDLLATVSNNGFDGIYIDRLGYPDRAAKLESELGEVLKTEPLVSPDGRKSFFNLSLYKERL